MKSQIFETRLVKAWMRSDRIFQEVFKDGVEVSVSEMREIVMIAHKYFPKKNLIYVNMSKVKSVPYETRQYLKTEEASIYVKAVALKVESKVSAVIANFINLVNRTEFPTKVFTDEDKAIEWLTEYNSIQMKFVSTTYYGEIKSITI